MKTIYSICLICLCQLLFAQDQSSKLFTKSDHIGGFGGASLTVFNNGEYTIGGEGAWMISNYYIGGFGYGSAVGSYASDQTGPDYDVRHSAGGFMFGAFSNTTNLFALYSEVKVAFGDLTATQQLSENTFEEYSESVTTFTPMVGVSITPWDYMQIRAFGGYQFATDVDLLGIGNEPLQRPVFGIGIYIGAFNY